MKVSEAITKLQAILEEKGDLPILCVWTESDEDGEEYNIKESPLFYGAFNEVWITY